MLRPEVGYLIDGLKTQVHKYRVQPAGQHPRKEQKEDALRSAFCCIEASDAASTRGK